jgi:hypothetical protein
MTPMSDFKPDSGRINDQAVEQLVPREESPIDIGAAVRPSGDGAQGLPDSAGTSPAVVQQAVGSGGDPKRVHTVPINADAGTSNRNGSRASTSAQTQSPSRQIAPPAAQAQVQPQVLPQVQPQVQPQPQPPAPPPPTRQLAAVAPAVPADIGDAAAAPPTVESGGYVVQLAAVRSEADAQTAFRQQQAKYPILNGRQPLIRRKDQGERGIFFAAQIGPFGAKSDADQLCDQLKSAGGSCFVQRN